MLISDTCVQTENSTFFWRHSKYYIYQEPVISWSRFTTNQNLPVRKWTFHTCPTHNIQVVSRYWWSLGVRPSLVMYQAYSPSTVVYFVEHAVNTAWDLRTQLGLPISSQQATFALLFTSTRAHFLVSRSVIPWSPVSLQTNHNKITMHQCTNILGNQTTTHSITTKSVYYSQHMGLPEICFYS